MSRVAWFSPLPPSTSGIAAYSAEVLPLLRTRGLTVDSFTEANAHDFVWMQRRRPYALTVFQIGNAACHDYMWAYLFRYPGLVVLHDAQLHQARALFLTKRWRPRRRDYLAEFRANHPEANPDVAELVAAGLGGSLYAHWPLTRLVIERARLVAVHNARLADELRQQRPGATVAALEMGVAEVTPAPGVNPVHVRARHGIPAEAMVMAAFGGITPEKRISQLIRALSAVSERHPRLHLLLVGAEAAHYDVHEDARTWGISDRVHVAGYVADEELGSYLLTADFCACLRWPTNRETSASWLRCLAAGRATIITELAHLADVPTVDPRGWRVMTASSEPASPVAVSIDLLDEEHSLQLAFERLATDAAFRQQLGAAARAWWARHHQLGPMAEAYERLIHRAMQTQVPDPSLPSHLLDEGARTLIRMVEDLDLRNVLGDLMAD